ncbi:MAG: hypothetical protein KKD31_07705 [Bacteroidetes bacterium]|nr:hypothetical protein [Bacteroidota bacterium]
MATEIEWLEKIERRLVSIESNTSSSTSDTDDISRKLDMVISLLEEQKTLMEQMVDGIDQLRP